jgi:ankyrin repeat protein
VRQSARCAISRELLTGTRKFWSSVGKPKHQMSKALKEAIEANDPEAVSKALKGVKDLNRKLPGAKAPLVYASERGAVKVLEPLVKAGAMAEKRNTFPGDTPFAAAATHKQFEGMKELLRLNQVSNPTIDHVWHNAAMNGKADVLEFVLANLKPEITIEWFELATKPANGAEQLKLLLKYGGNLKGRYKIDGSENATLLHDLVGPKVPIIRTLIECGAEINARDSLGVDDFIGADGGDHRAAGRGAGGNARIAGVGRGRQPQGRRRQRRH